MEGDLRFALISLLVSAIVAPLVLLIANKLFSKPKDTTDYAKNLQEIADQAVADLRTAKEELRDMELRHEADKQAFNKRLLDVEAAVSGPFRVTLEIQTSPALKIVNPTIELIKKVTGPLSTPAGRDSAK